MPCSTATQPLTDVFNWGRPFGPLTFFYVVVRLFPQPEQRRLLLTGAAVLAAAAGVVALVVALGSPIGDALAGGSKTIVKEEEGTAGLLRVRLAGLSMAYALFWYVAVRIATGESRPPLGLGAAADRHGARDRGQLQPQHVARAARRAGADDDRRRARSSAVA